MGKPVETLNLVDGKSSVLITPARGGLVTRFSRGDKIDLAYTFEENEWNGEKRFQLNVKDIKLSA